MPLNEKALRKPSWDEQSGTWITLADGQEWLLPKPWVKRRPSLVDGTYVFGTKTEFGAEFDALVAQAETNWLPAMAALGVFLLQRNYTLTDDETLDLLTLDSRSEVPWTRGVYAAANGNDAPKPGSDGDA